MREPDSSSSSCDAAADSRSSDPTESGSRRSFLATAGSAAMVGGLAAGYGTFGYCAIRYLLPDPHQDNLDWQFVGTLDDLSSQPSISFTASSGSQIIVARAAEVASGFLALSSVCPHLGCRVFWEEPNNRFFCPCHNGVFDPSGKAIDGPPAEANQSLTQYPTRILNGALYVKAPVKNVTREGREEA